MQYHYSICGVGIWSELNFPELPLITCAQPHLRISEGSVHDIIPAIQPLGSGSIYGGFIQYQSTSKGIWMDIHDVGQVWLDDSGDLVVEQLPGAQPEDMRFYILGAVLGLFLIRRGAFPVHGSTVSDGRSSILFCGPSRAGKSTLSAWFLDKGYQLVADDISLVHFSEDQIPKVWPGIPQVKLWDDSVRALSRNPDSLPLLLDNWEKRRLPVDPASLSGNAPLKAVFLLNAGSLATPEIRELIGMQRFAALAGNIYRGEAVLDLGKSKDHFAFVTRLAACTPVYALSRPEGRFALKEIQELVENTLNQLHEPGTAPR